MEERLVKLENRVKRLSLVNTLLSFIISALILYGFNSGSSGSEDMIRTRGIVIEDSLGRERILIGAPIPFATNRIRTDTVRAMEQWQKYFGKKYPEYYRSYYHQANGILILDEKGFDKVAIGDPTPDPNIGKRIGPANGINIYDDRGFERGGFGLLNVNGVDRVVLGIDSDKGTEGMYMMLTDDGVNGMGIRNGKNEIFLGESPANYLEKSWQGIYHGIMVKDSAGVRFDSRKAD